MGAARAGLASQSVLEDARERVELGRIVVGARGARTMVVDAAVELREAD